MKKYFLHNGKEQHGPYSLDELKQKGLTAKTMIWFDGISNWTEAQFIPELKEFATATPPPFEKTNPINQTFDKAKKVLDKDYVNKIEEKIPNNTGKKVFKYSLIVLAILGLAFIINMLMPSQERKEKNNAEEFIKINEIKLGHFGPGMDWEKGRWAVKGNLTNSAKTVTYKDIKIELEFFTESSTSLGKTILTVYKTFPPNNLQDKWADHTYFDVDLDAEPPKDFSSSKTKFKLVGADIFEQEKASQ